MGDGATAEPQVSTRLRRIFRVLQADPRYGPDARIGWAGEVIEVQRDEDTVLVAEAATLPEAIETHVNLLASRSCALLIIGAVASGLLERFPKGVLAVALESMPSDDGLFLAVHSLLSQVEQHRRDADERLVLLRHERELSSLVEIARALSQERDIDTLLQLILQKSRALTYADAASIYVVERSDEHGPRLRFKLSQNASCEFASSEFTVPISNASIAGFAALMGRPLNVPDVYAIGSQEPYGFDQSFDQRVGYLTRSMIAVPLKSARGEVIGVIALINRKRDWEAKLQSERDLETQVIPFDDRSEELLLTLGSQAGVALENAMLYDEIKRIFDGFVRASVQAIEQRDPTTSGHSLRVSVLSCALAKRVDACREAPFVHAQFSRQDLKQLEYAALLHDFGKIGVREEVLLKAKKLFPHQLQAIEHRVHFAKQAAELERMHEVGSASQLGTSAFAARFRARRAELEAAWSTVVRAAEPTVLQEGDFASIEALRTVRFVDGHGREQPLLTEEEARSLSVRRGSLNEEELEEIRSHVVHTFNFLARIPWGDEFRQIPAIAAAHHERIDGSGYPYGLSDEQIPFPAKMLAIADVFDALTAHDRPYKPAVPIPKALAILEAEADAAHLDRPLVRLFIEAEVYRSVEGELTY